MKSPTGELLALHAEADTERQPSGFTGGLDLYDELIGFLSSSPEPQQAVEHIEIPGVIPTPPTTSGGVPEPTVSVANSGALPQTGDVIKITGPLVGFAPAKAPTSAIIVCGDCGQFSDSDELFCIHCGGLLEQAAASAETAFTLAGLCDDCGAVVESDEIFCPACGAVMTHA